MLRMTGIPWLAMDVRPRDGLDGNGAAERRGDGPIHSKEQFEGRGGVEDRSLSSRSHLSIIVKGSTPRGQFTGDVRLSGSAGGRGTIAQLQSASVGIGEVKDPSFLSSTAIDSRAAQGGARLVDNYVFRRI